MTGLATRILRRSRLPLGCLLLSATALWAQNNSRAAATIGFGTDQHNEFSVMATGVWTAGSGGTMVDHRATGGGALALGYRFRFDWWDSIEVDYERATIGQRYMPKGAPGPYGATYAVASTMQDFTVNNVMHARRGDRVVRPFALMGTGVVFFHPRGSPLPTVSDREVGLDAGFGADFHLLHFGLRLQYRALGYRVPDFGNGSYFVNRMTVSSEPSAGLIFTF